MLIRTALALLLLLPAAASAQDLDAVVSSVVKISGTKDGTPVRGSGFVVGLDRDKATIVTASHVIEGVQQLEVTFGVDLTQSFPAGRVLGIDTGNPRGLAVFQVSGALPAGVTALSFETEAQLQRGEDVYLLGFPFMATAPLALRRTFAGPAGNFLQLDLAAGEDCSGAPVLRQGKVLGVVVDETPQISFAVKALVARDALTGWGIKLGEQSAQASNTATQVKPPAPVDKPCSLGEELTESGITWVRICQGTFTMGSAQNDSYDDEKPAHQVTLSEFWLGKTEITNKQYRQFQPNHQGVDELPATNITWDDAKAACEHFGGRLPTEAEWEYAARAGSQTAWSFGDDKRKVGEYAWYADNSGDQLHPVGTKKANTWGLYDMHGNAREWVLDWFGPYSGTRQIDPTGPTSGKAHVLRGGSINYNLWGLRSAYRLGTDPDRRKFKDAGFRCARGPRRQP